MNQVEQVFMQIKPTKDCRRVQFMNDCFSLDDIKIISAVHMEGRMLYRFYVTLYGGEPLKYDFETKATALKAQRCLARAYTGTGEFAYGEDGVSTGKTP